MLFLWTVAWSNKLQHMASSLTFRFSWLKHLIAKFSVLLQVNGKQYPLAKIQLGGMGALHPANRLAAYLTGREGSQRQQQASSSSEPSCILQNSPHSTSSASSVPPTPAAPTVTPAMLQSQPLVTQPTLPGPPASKHTCPASEFIFIVHILPRKLNLSLSEVYF